MFRYDAADMSAVRERETETDRPTDSERALIRRYRLPIIHDDQNVSVFI